MSDIHPDWRLSHNDQALSSGPYSYGYTHAFGRIPRMYRLVCNWLVGLIDGTAGEYTLVVSAFEPRHIGKYSLQLECSDRFEFTPILQEGAGMFNRVIQGEW